MTNIRIVEDAKYHSIDPFYHAFPCWQHRVLPMLPCVMVDTRDRRAEAIRRGREESIRRDIEKIMAVKIIAESEAPKRIHIRAGSSLSAEYYEAVDALNKLPAGKAIIVGLTSNQFTVRPPDVEEKKWKPEVLFAYSIRRYCGTQGVAVTAYQSGKLEVTVRRMSKEEIEAKRRRADNKKRKK